MAEYATTALTAPSQASPAIPVALKEAALDSPTFRATAIHFADQIDAIERWLEDYAKSTAKVTRDILALEETINSYLSKIIPPPAAADAVIDNDYTLLALKRVGDGSREWWTQMLATVKKLEMISVDPIRSFMTGDLRIFKETRRTLDSAQKTFDSTLARYVSQSKTKEASSLREDAFAVYETRKAYLKASMDYCLLAPQLRFTLDKVLVRVSSDIWKEMKRSRDAATMSTKWGSEMDRIRGWSKEMDSSEATFKRELQIARRDIGESTLQSFKPSRELDGYSTSTVPFLGSRGPMALQPHDDSAVISEKQGWLFLRTISGKPARTNWTRRWYYCRDGIFGWLVQGPQGVLQGDEIGVLLCNAKPAVAEERRFCFEVKTKAQTMLLQAETQSELTEWLEVFEVAKKQAFEASMGRDNASLPGGADPAFSITPPTVPEFSAKSLDSPFGGEEPSVGFDRTTTLPVPGPDGNLSSRASFDINAAGPRRSITALGRDLSRDLVREEGESGREHAARIIQKFDLHRKATFGNGAEGAIAAATAPGGGGIASLISANHSLFPGYSGLSLPQGSSNPSRSTGFLPPLVVHGSLAPKTFARPPVPTNLSRTALAVTSELGMTAGTSSHMPTAVMANYWGSSAWSAVYGPRQAATRSPGQLLEDPFHMAMPDAGEDRSGAATGHRKTLSVDASIGHPQSQPKQQVEAFTRNYPPELRSQHPQFRLLFPTVPLDEKLVLVFSAAWVSSSDSESASTGPGLTGNGRIYVTPDNMYFYGHQMGLVVAYTISLDIITEVTGAPGKDCDYIFLHLGQDMNSTGYKRITIKVFLDNLRLLHARLNLLVDDLQAEEPMEVDEIVTALLNLENESYDLRSPSVGSWEEVSSSTPMDDGTASGRPAPRRYDDFGGGSRMDRLANRLPPKFQLPAHPVVYEPDDMQRKVAERNFEISAKACFHVLFGDKSFVFPKLYFERKAQQIAQGPWLLTDHGRMKREFQFKVDYSDILGRAKTTDIVDFQTIDVFSDHVSYVVTHIRTAWHLPHSQDFKLVTKVVITHVAKSKCKLAIYTKVDWSKAPAFSKNLVERQALDDAGGDAEDLADVATDQVRKLGPHSRTKRAIQVYGHIGQQTQVVVFSPAESDSTRKQLIKPRTLTAMLLETLRSFGESAVTSIMMWAFAVLKTFFKVLSAHRLIILLLALSAVTNVFLTWKDGSAWWIERRSVKFLNRLGVGPNMMTSKAIYMADLMEASGTVGYNSTWPIESACFYEFQLVANTTDLDSPWEDAGSTLSSPASRATARRIRRRRQRLGSQRHDLLVAMRIVNSMEREMVRAEWENWLEDENTRCDQLKIVLHEGKGTGKLKTWSTQQGKGLDAEPGEANSAFGATLKEWYDVYCRSCHLDQQALMSERQFI